MLLSLSRTKQLNISVGRREGIAQETCTVVLLLKEQTFKLFPYFVLQRLKNGFTTLTNIFDIPNNTCVNNNLTTINVLSGHLKKFQNLENTLTLKFHIVPKFLVPTYFKPLASKTNYPC